MSRADAHIALYSLVEEMTIAAGYNYDWVPRYDIEKSSSPKPNGKAMLTIEFGAEENQDDQGGAGTGQYIDVVTVTMTASVATAESDSKMSSIAYDQSVACSLAISDVKKMFNNAPLQDDLCEAGVHDLHYTGSTIEILRDADKYTGKRAVCSYAMQYRSER